MGGADLFLEDWEDMVKVQNQATLDGSPVAQAIIRFMDGVPITAITASSRVSNTDRHTRRPSLCTAPPLRGSPDYR